MFTKKQLLTKGLLSVAPHMFSVIPFGIVCGAIGIELGFSPVLVYAMSIIIFGGASQIVFLQLLSGGASALIAVTSVGVINSRHLLYGAVLSEYLEKLSFIKKLLISYLVVDQGCAESNRFFQKNKNEPYLHYHLLGSGGTLWICWQLATLSGIILGSFVPEELGLKFAVPLTFIAIVVQDNNKDVEIGSYPFFRQGKLGVSIVLRSKDQDKINLCNSLILEFVKAKKIRVVELE